MFRILNTIKSITNRGALNSNISANEGACMALDQISAHIEILCKRKAKSVIFSTSNHVELGQGCAAIKVWSFVTE